MQARAKRQLGFTLIEVMVGLVLMALALVVLSTMVGNSAERSRETLAAQHMRQVVDASQRYVADNNATLLASATASTPVVLSVATLKTAGYLPTQFTVTNPYQQSYQIRVLEPTAGTLSTLVITGGGEVIGEGGLRRIARQIGAEGGYVSSSANTTATGAYGGWSQVLSTYGAANGAGRVAASLFFKDGQQVSDFLYRSTVAGHPEMNTMAAPINMGNNDITNVDAVTANGAVQGGTVRSTGRLSANEFVQLGTAITVGTACTPVGLLGREADGRLASCVSGTWRRAGF